jgi:DNA-nicking Smr family endonuclease
MERKEKTHRTGNLGELRQVIKDAGMHLKSTEPVAPIKPAPHPVPQPSSCPQSDEEIFADAMHNVRRAEWRHNRVRLTQPPPAHSAPSGLEEQQLMRESIEGELAPLVQEHPEYIEGWIGVVGKRYLPNLRNGLYSIQEQLDLHGFNRVEARAVVEDFISRMSRFRSCCVKIIHGRGINSPDDRAILKDNLQRWLSTRRMSRYVVAYASAPLNDGGVGAVYVLLRHP